MLFFLTKLRFSCKISKAGGITTKHRTYIFTVALIFLSLIFTGCSASEESGLEASSHAPEPAVSEAPEPPKIQAPIIPKAEAGTDPRTSGETEIASESESEIEAASESESETQEPSDGEKERTKGSGNILLTVRKLDPAKPMVALTFDDGPSKSTVRSMKLIEENNGRATFCVVGERLGTYSDTLRRMVENGHQIASHTWEHTNLKKVNKAEAISAVTSVSDYMKTKFGYEMSFFRPPYGAVNDTVKAASDEMGLGILYWSFDTLDWSTKNAAATLKAVKDEVRDGSIILCHDLYSQTADAVDDIVPYLVERGYQLVTVDELLYYKRGGANTGRIYYNG